MTVTKEKRDGPEPEARRLRRELFAEEMLDQLMAPRMSGVSLTGEGGFLPEMVKAVLERGMDAELTDHLGYERGDPAGRGSGNSRNGTTAEDGSAPRSGTSAWISRGTVTARSPRGWCPRVPAAWAGWRT